MLTAQCEFTFLHKFAGTFVFDQDISGWDVSKVTSMAAMYFGALAFNHDISGWDVSSVTSMEYMFYGASAFNQDIGGWDISLVNNMESMVRITVLPDSGDAIISILFL